MLLLPPWDAKWEEAAPKGSCDAAWALLQDPCPCQDSSTGWAQRRKGAVGAAPHSTAHTGPHAARGACRQKHFHNGAIDAAR